MKTLPIITMTFCALVSARADTITGQFDWSGSIVYGVGVANPMSGTALFSYDTVANHGEVSGLLDSFGVYSGHGVWQFSVTPTNLAPIAINSFADLTDFGTHTVTVTPQFYFMGVLVYGTPYDVTYSDVWNFSQTPSISGGARYNGTDFIAFDQQLFNPPNVVATFSNIAQTPEPSSFVLLSLATSVLLGRRRRRDATPNQALQRTAPAVTLAASCLRLSPTVQPARQPPPSLSLGSLGDSSATSENIALQ